MTALEQENITLKEEVFILKTQLEQLRRLVFGAKRERFVSDTDPNQGILFEQEHIELHQVQEEQTVVVKKKNKTKREVAAKRNIFPPSLRREEQIVEPEEVNENMIKIGEDVTEILAYQPADLYVKSIIRPRYADKTYEDAGIKQANIPARLIPKGIVDESLVAQIIVEKILFHTPIFRFRKKLLQAGINFISENNLYNWFQNAGHQLLPLYHLLHQDMLGQPYNQADETRITVLSKNKPGASHRGYFWVLYNPKHNVAFFQYDARRNNEAGQALMPNYQGIVQSDGYSVYESIKNKQRITLIHCMAHARRKFFDAQNTDPPNAQYFLSQVQQLYKIESEAREKKYTYEQRLALRQEQAIPILEDLGQWLKDQLKSGKILPRSPIGQALGYALRRWDGLCAYAHDGQLEIDNNLVENTIRPVALGRKNYLFAGSDEGAQVLACLYSIVGTANKHGFNVQKYLTWLLRKVAANKITPDTIKWLPHRMDEELRKTFLL